MTSSQKEETKKIIHLKSIEKKCVNGVQAVMYSFVYSSHPTLGLQHHQISP